MAKATEDTHFGYETVPLAEKQGLVDDVFHSVARRYDLMNDLMSGGLHRAWKDALVTAVNPPKSDKPFTLLDLAGGTGDVAFRVVEAGGGGTRVTVCDINAEMLSVGRELAAERGHEDAVTFEQGNAEELPYPDRSFDCVTIAFGIRNVPRIERALSEAFRVLRIGGRFLCLEFSSVDVPGLDKIYDLYSQHVIPNIGRAVRRYVTAPQKHCPFSTAAMSSTPGRETMRVRRSYQIRRAQTSGGPDLGPSSRQTAEKPDNFSIPKNQCFSALWQNLQRRSAG